MEKYYRVLKDNFLWKRGAILLFDPKEGVDGGYRPINDVLFWNANSYVLDEYISARIVESSPDWFEQVYREMDGSSSVEYLNDVQKKREIDSKFVPKYSKSGGGSSERGLLK